MEWVFPAVSGKPPCPRHGTTMTSLTKNKILLIGGWTRGVSNADIIDEYHNDVYILDFDESKWTKVDIESKPQESPIPRSYHTATLVGDHIYLCNGGRIWCESAQPAVYGDLWKLDLSTRKWTQLRPAGDMPPACEGHSAFGWDGKLYIFGGFDGIMNYNDLFCYDPLTNTWDRVAQAGSVPEPRCYHSATLVGDQVFLFSGSLWDGYTGSIYEDFYSLDLRGFHWTKHELPRAPASSNTRPSSPCGRFAHSCVALSSNQLFIYGGWSIVDMDKSKFFGDGYLFDIVRGTWSRLSVDAEEDGPGILYGHAAARSGNDVVLFGGRDHLGNRNSLCFFRELNSNMAVPLPKPAIGAQLLSSWQSNDTLGSQSCDFALHLSGADSIPVHKFVLSSRSQKFKALFESGLSESSQPSLVITKDEADAPPTKKAKSGAPVAPNVTWLLAFRIMIEFLYSGNLDFEGDDRLKDSDVVMELLKLSDQYLVNDLKEQIEYWLQFSIDASNVAFLLSFADSCGAFRLRSACLSYFVAHYDHCINSDFWLQMPRDLQNEVEANRETRYRRRRERSGSAPSSQDTQPSRKRKR